MKTRSFVIFRLSGSRLPVTQDCHIREGKVTVKKSWMELFSILWIRIHIRVPVKFAEWYYSRPYTIRMEARYYEN